MNICAHIPGTTKIKAQCEKHFREHQRLFEMHSVIICTSICDRKYAILRLPAHLQRAAAIPTSLFCEMLSPTCRLHLQISWQTSVKSTTACAAVTVLPSQRSMTQRLYLRKVILFQYHVADWKKVKVLPSGWQDGEKRMERWRITAEKEKRLWQRHAREDNLPHLLGQCPET